MTRFRCADGEESTRRLRSPRRAIETLWTRARRTASHSLPWIVVTLCCGVACANRERGLEGIARSQPDLDRTLAAIDRRTMVATIDHLTSDACAGRDTPQPGLIRAIEFVEREFEAAGLEPLGETGFRHEYECSARTASASCSLAVRTVRGEFSMALATDFMPARFCGDASGGGELLFAGYGIQALEWDWDDYSGLDPRGRVVVVLAGEPRESSDGEFFDGREMTEAASIREKARLARKLGAVGLILVTVDEAEDRRWLETQLPSIDRGDPVADYALPTLVVNGRALGARLEVDLAAWRADLDSGRVRAGGVPSRRFCRLRGETRAQARRRGQRRSALPGSRPDARVARDRRRSTSRSPRCR